MVRTALIFAALFWAGVCFADTFTVGQGEGYDFDLIQDAIDNCLDGDTVLVYPGIYREDIFFNSMAVTVTSLDPDDPEIVASTFINGTVIFDTFQFRNPFLYV